MSLTLSVKITGKTDEYENWINWRVAKGIDTSKNDFLKKLVIAAFESSETNPIGFVKPTPEELKEFLKPNIKTDVSIKENNTSSDINNTISNEPSTDTSTAEDPTE